MKPISASPLQESQDELTVETKTETVPRVDECLDEAVNVCCAS